MRILLGILVGLLVVVGLSALLEAQNPVCLPGCRPTWDQVAPTLADAQGYTYRIYVDNATTGIATSATCTGTASPFTCVGLMPNMSNGTHQVTMTAANAVGESAKSSPFVFDFGVSQTKPAAPAIKGLLPPL